MNSTHSSSAGLMVSFRQQKRFLIFVGAVLFFILVWYLPWNNVHDIDNIKPVSSHIRSLSVDEYSNKIDIDQAWFVKNCLYTEDIDELKIEHISRIVKTLYESNKSTCKEFSNLFKSIYTIRESVSSVVINKVFAQKVLKWFGGNAKLLEQTKQQHVLFINNIVTQESTVFNPLRAKRPGAGAVGPEVKKIVDELISTSSKDCDFCNYKIMTAKDPFGSIESKYSVTVANTFKIEKFHGLMLWKHHNPMNFTKEQIVDFLDIALKWFNKAYEADKNYEYPHIYWDSLTKASASQIHPHVHLTLASGQYYSGWARLHESAVLYAKGHNGANYFTQLVKIHSLFGLAVHLGEATAFAYLTPSGSHEVMLISKKPSEDLFSLLFYTMRAYIDDMNLFATSMGMVFPKMVVNPSNSDLPMMIQLVYRGSQASPRSDISSFDIFGTHNVNVDPYIVIKSIRKTMMKYGALQ
ncbi:uncharacterized protein LOC110236748 [Exaiptasia diaphana]|uniref:Uncharacterized protein n=1 Tax=Exaiptasia diaphana TaxID=2652724 RepID=A0A913X2P2_EXADI|nr:uncharacterized protein LOC110236748 [Exaiptasia diaphana]KXJ15889.1 hypothetical protein AC249_AIPGENE17793 [Exaiptasia diaphana]